MQTGSRFMKYRNLKVMLNKDVIALIKQKAIGVC